MPFDHVCRTMSKVGTFVGVCIGISNVTEYHTLKFASQNIVEINSAMDNVRLINEEIKRKRQTELDTASLSQGLYMIFFKPVKLISEIPELPKISDETVETYKYPFIITSLSYKYNLLLSSISFGLCGYVAGSFWFITVPVTCLFSLKK